jgi:hypothetical protein
VHSFVEAREKHVHFVVCVMIVELWTVGRWSRQEDHVNQMVKVDLDVIVRMRVLDDNLQEGMNIISNGSRD